MGKAYADRWQLRPHNRARKNWPHSNGAFTSYPSRYEILGMGQMNDTVPRQAFPPKPQQFAQKLKMPRGWSIVRNSATLATTDYEHIADEIVAALNAKFQEGSK